MFNSLYFYINQPTMKKHLALLCCFLVMASISFAQAKPKPVAKATSPLNKLMSATGLPFTMANDSLAVIPYEGEHIESYQVIVQKVSDMYIIYTDLTEALPGLIDESKYKYLLLQNGHFDIIKIGLGEDGVMYVRADIYRSTVTSAILGRVIRQVANVTNIIGGELKKN
jgi:hypothetical protein